MKRILTIICIIFTGFFTIALALPELRDYNGVELPAGTFVPVASLQEFSTANSDYRTPLHFVATNDIYLFETNVIPQNTVFSGAIEKKNEPIIGTNASMTIKIFKMTFPDGHELPMKGYIHTPNNNLIGGELTQPAKYDKMPHYTKGFSSHYIGILQYVPGESRKMGEHTAVASGADLLIVFTEPMDITHTVQD